MTTIGVPSEIIENKIFIIRGQKVMLDKHLADLYRVKPIRLLTFSLLKRMTNLQMPSRSEAGDLSLVKKRSIREQVKRNADRFPSDFIFQLKQAEVDFMVSQNAIPSLSHLGGHLPYAFTEQGIAMLSSVLHSPRAVQVNIAIMRAFVKLRELMISHKDLARKMEELEEKFKKHDENFVIVFKAIKKILEAPKAVNKKKMPIGFHVR